MHAGPYEDETAIALPMTEDKATEILTNQERSRYVQMNRGFRPLLMTTLDRLAKLQGYGYATFIRAEEPPRQDEGGVTHEQVHPDDHR